MFSHLCMLHTLRPEIPIMESVRYASTENFLGTIVKGYEHTSHIRCTPEAGYALKDIQHYLDSQKLGYSLVVYDGYLLKKR